MGVKSRILPDTYQDSIVLMRVAGKVLEDFELEDAFAIVGTESNLEVLEDAGLMTDDAANATSSDVVLAVSGEVDADDLDRALDEMEAALKGEGAEEQPEGAPAPIPPRSLSSGFRRASSANLVAISTPGEYAAREAWKALKMGLHVYLFSDNVPLEEEIALKEYGAENDLLVMGPDAGTAWINGLPLGFANAVTSGSVGIVSAAGTGLQEVMSLVDRFGGGISQGIGTGGRDLKDEVGGLMMKLGLESLAEDPETEVIVLISKPPDPKTLKEITQTLSTGSKPIVVNFIGGDLDVSDFEHVHVAETLEDAAWQAVDLLGIAKERPIENPRDIARDLFTDLGIRTNPRDRRYVRGLYSGGTLASEAVVMLEKALDQVYSNISVGTPLDDARSMMAHSIVDYGEDEFTQARPHPMLDPRVRNQYLKETLEDPTVAVVLLDVVLGYGAHENPAQSVAETIQSVPVEKRPAILASVCGTEQDPQQFSRQKETLEAAGVMVAPSNAAAVKIARELTTFLDEDGGNTNGST